MVTSTPAVPPAGFVDFCARHLQDCIGSSPLPVIVDLDARRGQELEAVQADINRTIRPREIPAGVWEYPMDGTGDCNQYALAKQRALIALGWPREALLLTVAITEQGEGHLLLIVRTSAGDLALDNRAIGVVDWTRLPYRWIERQSQQRPTDWVTILGRQQITAESPTERAARY
ncbi:MAG: transglutaminase-like cysteine peptidase [Stellaceae bacterium]